MTLFGPAGGAEAPGPVRASRGPGDLTRVRMTVAYNGSGFRGFAAQPGITTVAGTLAQAIQAVVGHPVDITCAGRTDAGVHAIGQVIHFDIDRQRARGPLSTGEVDALALRRSCNRMLAPAIVVRAAALAPEGFDARRSALWRRYRYLVLNREDPDPFLAATAWHIEAPLDLRSMQLSCDAIHGEHDFSAFCRRPADGGSTVRRVQRAEWSALFVPHPGTGRDALAPAPELLSFEIVAGAFCHQMVRSLVGTMVDAGRGRRRAGEMAGILRGRDRAAAGSPAPPHGLCLEEVGYPDLATGAGAGPAGEPGGPAFAPAPHPPYS